MIWLVDIGRKVPEAFMGTTYIHLFYLDLQWSCDVYETVDVLPSGPFTIFHTLLHEGGHFIAGYCGQTNCESLPGFPFKTAHTLWQCWCVLNCWPIFTNLKNRRPGSLSHPHSVCGESEAAFWPTWLWCTKKRWLSIIQHLLVWVWYGLMLWNPGGVVPKCAKCVANISQSVWQSSQMHSNVRKTCTLRDSGNLCRADPETRGDEAPPDEKQWKEMHCLPFLDAESSRLPWRAFYASWLKAVGKLTEHGRRIFLFNSCWGRWWSMLLQVVVFHIFVFYIFHSIFQLILYYCLASLLGLFGTGWSHPYYFRRFRSSVPPSWCRPRNSGYNCPASLEHAHAIPCLILDAQNPRFPLASQTLGTALAATAFTGGWQRKKAAPGRQCVGAQGRLYIHLSSFDMKPGHAGAKTPKGAGRRMRCLEDTE